jgi:hypothetical protein
VIDPAIKQRLKYVKVSRDDVDLDRFPHFLIVGPQRTGTTWLHAHLRFHPQIFLAEPKELFFFSRLKSPQDPKFESDDLGWYLQFFRDPPWRFLAKTAIALRRYGELYRPKVRGEATASYAALPRDVIEEITTLNPQIKAIFLTRNPVDRAWSHAKKDLARKTGRKIEDVPENEFEAFFTDPYQRQCARFVENFDNWTACLKPGHLFAGRFDDIASNPDKLLLDVMKFLGVRSDACYVSRDIKRPVNPTSGERAPEKYRRLLEELLADDVKQWRERFDAKCY